MKKNSIFPAIVLGFSLIAAADSIFATSNWLGLINSAIGILGGTLYFLKNDRYRQLINIWIYLQFVLLTKAVTEPNSYNSTEYPIIDFTQFFKLKFGFALIFNETSYTLSFNFLPLIYLYAFKKLQINDLVGGQLNLSLYRSNEILNEVLPQTVTVIETIEFGKSSDWLLTQLSKPIDFNEKKYEYCLIRSKDDLPITPNKKGQMVHLRLVDNVNELRANRQLNNYQFIDWALVS